MADTHGVARTDGRHLFGHDPGAYDRGRPGYPRALYDRLRERCGLGPRSRIFEVGAGTGLATRKLLELEPAELWAVEPDSRLARHLSDTLGSPRLRVVESAFEDAPLPSGGFDLGVAAMALHWLRQHEALTKAYDALTPGGWWAMWWTLYGRDAEEDAFTRATRPLFEGLPTGPSNAAGRGLPFALDKTARMGELAAARLEQAEVDSWSWDEEFSTARLVDLYSTYSAVHALPQSESREFLERLARIADEQFGGHVIRPLRTVLYTARRPK